MYAIIASGGKQRKVKEGDLVDVEILKKTQTGDQVEFQPLFLNSGTEIKVGTPHVKGSLVIGEVVEEVYGPKVVSMKYKRSHHNYRKFGHRQRYTRVKIKEIKA